MASLADRYDTYIEKLEVVGEKRRVVLEQEFMEWDEPGLMEHIAEFFPTLNNTEFKLLMKKLPTHGEAVAPCIPSLLERFLSNSAGHSCVKAIAVCLEAIGAPAGPTLLEFLARSDMGIDKKRRLAGLLPLLPVGSVGEELWPLIEQHCTSSEVKLSVLLVRELGRHRVSSLTSQLVALAGRQLRKEDDHSMHFEMLQECMKALVEIGEEATHHLGTLHEWLEAATGGARNTILYAIIALDHEGVYDEEIKAVLATPNELSESGFATILSGIQRSQSMRFFDQLLELLNDSSLRRSTNPLNEAFVACLSKGMESTELLAWVRQLLGPGPSERLWLLLGSLVNAISEEEQEVLIPYLQEHLAGWPAGICKVDLSWSYKGPPASPFYQLHREHLDLQPSWQLVRSFHFDADDVKLRQTYLFRMLASPDAQFLENLEISYCRLERSNRLENLIAAELPSLKRLTFTHCHLPYKWVELLCEAPWVGRIKKLALHSCAARTEEADQLREALAPHAVLEMA